MKQILQSLKTGLITKEEVPAPEPGPGQLLVLTQRSLVSAGTERMLVEFGRASWLDKARSQPDKVKQVFEKVKSDGLLTTYDAVQSKLDQPLALGYCNVGVVAALGTGTRGFVAGERVVSNGKHAEVVCVPRNLCAAIPDGVSDDTAAFTVLAAIGLQGIRLVNPSLGECVVVTGLGLIGLLTVQMLRAHGCRVLGLDVDPSRLELARRFGAETVDLSAGADPLAAARTFSRGRGVDAVIITASTKSNDPVTQGARMCRKRGRIVLVGVAGLELSRADFYEKELSFQVSCSYGPGRYDSEYEDGGHDYPVGFVRWTEQRNFEAVLDLMAAGAIEVEPLISHRFALDQAEGAYALLGSGEASLGILLDYASERPSGAAPSRLRSRTIALGGKVVSSRASVGFIGTGNYAGRVLIPAFKAAGAGLHTALSHSGVSAVHYGKKHGFAQASTDVEAMLESAELDTIVIATRHASHASLAVRALQAGKHVFVEKPLCLTLAELAALAELAGDRPGQCLMVGFNRRFAPHVLKIKSLLAALQEPKALVMTVNAGAIPGEHWTQDPSVGGGRIVGEACHFIDLLRHLAGCRIIEHTVLSLGRAAGAASGSRATASDNVALSLRFEDGSLGTIHYLANGHKGFPKERLEVFCAGRVLELDNFRKLRGWGWPGFSRLQLLQQDKGQTACAQAFVTAIRSGGRAPIALDEILEVSRVSIEAQQMVAR